MLGRILGVLGVPMLIVGIIWLAVVIYFQQVGGDISSTDLVVWFALVPLGAVVIWFAGKTAYARSKRPAEAAATEPAAPDLPAERDAKLSLRLSILSAEINTAAGESPDLLQAIRQGDLSPAFAENLVDGNGMPVKASVCTALESDEYLPWVEQWLRTAGHTDGHVAQEGARLLAILHGPLQRTLDVLINLPVPSEEPHAADQMFGASRQTPREKSLRPLVTKVFAPAAWQEMVIAYVRGQVSQASSFSFGVVRPDPERPELQFDVLRVADAFCKASADIHAGSILMVVSCDSLTAQEQVDALDAQSRLFSSANQGGIIPGEAAAVILAAPSALVTALGIVDPPPLANLHRAAFGARQKPVDASGRIDAEHLEQLTTAALANAAQDAAAVAALVSDCDHRSPWLTESAMLISGAFSELDPVADHAAISNALGSVGQAGSTLTLALAANAIAIDEKPLLTASLTDTRARSVAILSPWQAPAAPLNNSAALNPS